MAKSSKPRDPAKHSKKDPARPTRAKASRPDVPAIDPALADILNPALGQGTAGIGSQTGLKPPSDNSWDRRADFANAHRARKSTQGKAEGFEERPQSGYAAKGSTDNPQLSEALGGDADPTKSLIGAPPDHDELADIFQSQREKRHRPMPQPITLGVGASMQHWKACCAKAGPNSASKSYGRRIARRGRKNPKAASLWSSNHPSSQRAISRRRSRIWSRASAATTACKCCWASPARARPSPWPR